MALRSGERGWVKHLSFLLTCLLLITGGARGSQVVEVEIEGEGGGSGEGEEVGSEAVEYMAEREGVVVTENGTAEAVVLDCPYHLEEKDLNGFYIAWYHPTSASPVYLWIPENKPRAMWILRDRVDLTYEASTDALHRHSALRILNPTTELAGRYVCQISTFTVELSYTQDLIVFSEPSSLDVWVEVLDEGQVEVVCKVEEVYPQPVLYLYQKSSSKDREQLGGGTPVTSFSRGTYNMEFKKVVQEATLDGPTEFECHVTIPNTDVQIITSTKYQPRVYVTTGAVTGGTSTKDLCVLLAVLPFLICLLHD